MSSYWIESTKDFSCRFPALSNNLEVDVCIVGAGLVGISCAYNLINSGFKTIILERDDVCSHVSAYSTAKITSQHNLFYTYLIDSFGMDYAKDYLNANEEAVQRIKNVIKKENIDCDFSNQDSYVYVYSKKELADIKAEVNSVKSLGFPCEFVENIPFPISSYGAIKFPNQGQFNPRKYALSLCDIIVKNDIEIYSKTVVTKVERDSDGNYIVETPQYTVKAKYVVLATHYPIVNFPGFYFLKMYQSMSYVIAVDTKCELPDGMYINSSIPFYSFRTTPYNGKKLLLIAGSDHKTGEKINLENAYKLLEDKAKELYPESEVLYKWCTEDCISLDKIPYIGDFSSIMPNLFVATGFKKWGISFSNVAAKIIADKILGNDNKYEETFKATRLQPVKNREELGNMVKESMYSLVINKLKGSPDTLNDVKNGEGKIVEIDGKKVGVYKNEDGKCFFIKPVCAHLGCELSFNNVEKTWDCPCHGSRYDYRGVLISEPAIHDLEVFDNTELF